MVQYWGQYYLIYISQWSNDCFNKWQIYNFADDNIFSTEENKTDDHLELLKEESESAVQWFRENIMIVFPDQFQATVMQKGYKSKRTNNTLSIENITINTTKSVDLIGVAI